VVARAICASATVGLFVGLLAGFLLGRRSLPTTILKQSAAKQNEDFTHNDHVPPPILALSAPNSPPSPPFVHNSRKIEIINSTPKRKKLSGTGVLHYILGPIKHIDD